MSVYATYWLGAIHSRFAVPADWRSWADRVIERSDSPSLWILELSLTCDMPEAKKVLLDELVRSERTITDQSSYRDAALGYLFWKFDLDRLTFEAFLLEAGVESDNGRPGIDPEIIYRTLELYSSAGNAEDQKRVIDTARVLFRPNYNIARSQWKALGLADP